MGYVGRCSFDLLLTGNDMENARPEFIECNGRWGGTSIPMVLMNRLVGDWTSRPYTTRRYLLDELRKWQLRDLLTALRDRLFDPVSGHGRLVLMNASGVGHSGRLDVLAVGDSWREVEGIVDQELPELFRCAPGTPGYMSRMDTDRASSTASTVPSGTGCQFS